MQVEKHEVIVIKIKSSRLELSIDEAKELYHLLDSIVGTKAKHGDLIEKLKELQKNPPTITPNPWMPTDPWQQPIITYKDTTTDFKNWDFTVTSNGENI